MKGHRITVSDDVYAYLKSMIDDEHVANADMSEVRAQDGNIKAYRPTFSEVIDHMIQDREAA